MATILEHLKAVNAYPVPAPVLESAGIRWNVDLQQQLTKDIARSKEYNLCRADVLNWLAYAPNISQGGQTYSFSEDQRQQFIYEAEAIRKEYGEETTQVARFGYKGTRL